MKVRLYFYNRAFIFLTELWEQVRVRAIRQDFQGIHNARARTVEISIPIQDRAPAMGL